jgi:hypothetical protein
MGARNLTGTSPHSGGVRGDGTVARKRRATGEALLALDGNIVQKVGPITGSTGKWVEGERVADGSVVAMKAGNAAGAKGPC